MSKIIGFIGVGNMASAICAGAIRSGFLTGSQVVGYDPYPEQLEELARENNVKQAFSPQELVQLSDIVVLAVKPNMLASVLQEIKEDLKRKAVVSIALGWQYKELSEIVASETRIQAVMPNTPMLVGEGVCLFEKQNSLTKEELHFLTQLFESVGSVQVLPTYLMGIGGTISGCGPAYTYMFIEALADAGVYHGLPRKDAYKLASQMVLGAGKMVLQTGIHPGELKDNVCSPGGSTIRGVTQMEEKGLRAAVIDGVHKSMGK